MAGFDYRTATADEIEAEGQWLIGRPLDAISSVSDLLSPSSSSTKGVVGRVIEDYFGIERNSRAEPDFVGAGIELKSVPIQLTKVEARAKERVSLGMIDWASLTTETWATAKARHKLERLMLVFYEWSPLRPMGYFPILAAGIWTPDPLTIKAIEHDWEMIRQLELDGRRSEVSESLTTLLGACTKGPGHGSISRAWSLKQPFVGWIYRSMVSSVVVARAPAPHADPQGAFERHILERLAAVEGKPLADIAMLTDRLVGAAKSAAANTMRRYLGEKSKGRSGDFERYGIETKIVPIGGSGRPIEATSFPSFVHEELAFESWEDSDLLGRLNRMLFVPIERAKRQPQAEAIVRRAFFWSPTEAELQGIASEWENYRSLIAGGGAARLPTASQTKYIHVRPKARDASDRELAPGGIDVIRRCFWLNQDYVEQIIREHGGPSR